MSPVSCRRCERLEGTPDQFPIERMIQQKGLTTFGLGDGESMVDGN